MEFAVTLKLFSGFYLCFNSGHRRIIAESLNNLPYIKNALYNI